jgi:protein phosphatase 1 regulatory subunit 37
LALMMRDYPDSVITLSSLSPGLSSSTSSNSLHIPVPPPETRSSASQPSSAHASYASRSRRPASTSTEIDPALPPIPSITTSTTGGITTRTMPDGYKPPIPPKHHLTPGPDGPSSPASSVNNTNAEGRLSMGELGGASMALQRSVRALDGVERIGRLLTLDLKGNEIKVK